MSQYQQDAENFLKATNTTFKAEFLKYDKYFPSDPDKRDIYKITLTRGKRSFPFNFGQSLQNSGTHWLYGRSYRGVAHEKGKFGLVIGFISSADSEYKEGEHIPRYSCDWAKNVNYSIPTPYDVLSCLQKHDPGTFSDFCSHYGYDEDSRAAERIYHAVVNEFTQLKTLFTDKEMEQLQEIN